MSSSLQQAICEWVGTLPLWQQDLARRVAMNDRLSEDDVDQLLAILLSERDDGAIARPLTVEDLPSDAGADDPVELRRLGDLRNINCLAEGQQIRFESGLNVVYGDTGAGKSGHTRLLRRFCRSVQADEVLPDVFDPGAADAPQTAAVTVQVAGCPTELQLDLSEQPPRVMSSVSVFDAGCARMYVDHANAIDFVPRPLQLFDRMVRAQALLAERLRQQAASLQASQLELQAFTEGTAVTRLLGALDTPTAEQQLRQLAQLDDVERAELEVLSRQEADIKHRRAAETEAAARAAASAVRDALATLNAAFQAVSDQNMAAAQRLRTERDEIVAAQRQLADDALGDLPIGGTGGEPWKALWDAARQFAASQGYDFPDDSSSAHCVLCQQKLDDEARRRMERFEKFVANDLETRLGHLRERAHDLLRAAPDADFVGTKVASALAGVPDDSLAAIATTAAISYRQRRTALVALLSGNPASEACDVPVLAPLVAAAESFERTAASYADLRDDAKQREAVARLAELRDRARLNDVLDAVLKRLAQTRQRARMEKALRDLDTHRVSLAQRRLGAEVLTDDLRVALAEELRKLTPYPPRVTVAGSVRKGQTVMRLELEATTVKWRLTRVLSDGEQRALSLAFFFAELQVSKNRSAVVLDDPVTSLDQARREYVAQRLVREAGQRQVIVFTHDLAFLMLLQSEAEFAGVSFHGQTLRRAAGRVGLVDDELPGEGLTATKRLKHLRGQLDKLEKQHREGHVGYAGDAMRWCVELRQAWEQTIEEVVLQGVVTRFRPSIEPARLKRVVLDQEIKDRIDRAMERTSPWAHHRSPALGLPPRTPEQLREMAAELAQLHELLDPNKRAILHAVPQSGAA